MHYKCASFDEICRRAGGRRAYNKKRRLERAARICRILALQEQGQWTGRELAARLDVHEATISRDLKFINRVRADYRRRTGCEMWASSFSWIRGARGWETVFKISYGVRVR